MPLKVTLLYFPCLAREIKGMPLKVILLYFPRLAREIEGIPLRVAPPLRVMPLIIPKLILFASFYSNSSKLINIPKAL